jgi:hypothetical protein
VSQIALIYNGGLFVPSALFWGRNDRATLLPRPILSQQSSLPPSNGSSTRQHRNNVSLALAVFHSLVSIASNRRDNEYDVNPSNVIYDGRLPKC